MPNRTIGCVIGQLEFAQEHAALSNLSMRPFLLNVEYYPHHMMMGVNASLSLRLSWSYGPHCAAVLRILLDFLTSCYRFVGILKLYRAAMGFESQFAMDVLEEVVHR